MPSIRSFLLALLIACSVSAAPITYTMTGTVSGSLNSANFTDASFVITMTGDTANVTEDITDGGLFLINPAITSSFVIDGVGAGSFIDPMYAVSVPDQGTVAISIADYTGYVALGNGDANGWDLISPLGPLVGKGQAGSTPLSTTSGSLSLSPAGDFTFTAANAVPEPASLVLSGLALSVLAMTRMRLLRPSRPTEVPRRDVTRS